MGVGLAVAREAADLVEGVSREVSAGEAAALLAVAERVEDGSPTTSFKIGSILDSPSANPCAI